MEIFGFVISVWAALILGAFVIAMVIGCTLERMGIEAAKWWIFTLSVIAFVIWQWDGLSWDDLINPALWARIAFYLLIGLAYSVLEFLLDVRRSARYWADDWKRYVKTAPDFNDRKSLVTDYFIQRRSYAHNKIIEIKVAADQIEPVINHKFLTKSITCWTIFWPFYAISLIIGDLLNAAFRAIADLIVKASSYFVRVVFKDTFRL